MAFSFKDSKEGSFSPLNEINVTPFVDVMLVLLVIFMVTAPMMTQGLKVDLPKVSAEPIKSSDEKLTLTITKDKTIYIGKTRIDQAKLRQILKENKKVREDKEVLLHADKTLPYGYIVEIMAILKNSGANNVGMITDPIDEKNIRRTKG